TLQGSEERIGESHPNTFHVKHRTAPVAGYATGAVSFIELNFGPAATFPIFYGQNKGPLSHESDKGPSKYAG
ncbi:MAG: hypothetical protein KHZ14_08635, partial [Collinsella sp.]|nr:hypothetical protein [Collinsella sp.]